MLEFDFYIFYFADSKFIMSNVLNSMSKIFYIHLKIRKYYFPNVLKESDAAFYTLKREVRFTKVDIRSTNKSIATVLESSFKQFHNKQLLNVHAVVDGYIQQFQASKKIVQIIPHFNDKMYLQ